MAQHIIEGVIEMRFGKWVCFVGSMDARNVGELTKIKLYNDPNGGYQRPRSSRRVKEFSEYLRRDDSFIPPVIINAEDNWAFEPYDKKNSKFGRIYCNGRSSVIDGQHRLGGIEQYVNETQLSQYFTPFIAFKNLSLEEEISIFDTINSEQVGLPKSLLAYNNRGADEFSYYASQLENDADSAFYQQVSIDGKRSVDRWITLDGVKSLMEIAFNEGRATTLDTQEKYEVFKQFFRIVAETWPIAWADRNRRYKLRSRLAVHGLCYLLKALLPDSYDFKRKQLDIPLVKQRLYYAVNFDWSKEALKMVSGGTGSKWIGQELQRIIFSSEEEEDSGSGQIKQSIDQVSATQS